MNKKYIFANWKMNLNLDYAIYFVKQLIKNKKYISKNIHIGIYPPYIYLNTLNNILKNYSINNILIGAQNVHHENFGSYTGEISSLMLKNIGIKNVILGHSERRILFNENTQLIEKKIYNTLKNNMTPIICIGETTIDPTFNQTKQYLKKQLNFLHQLEKKDIEKIIIAYEPIWAIGTSNIANNDYIKNIYFIIKQIIFNVSKEASIPILYGGSINKNNINELIQNNTELNGVLIGKSSLNFEDFFTIIKHFQ